jgi:hypothetical protein
MCDQKPPKRRDDAPERTPRPMSVDDLRRAADSCRDLGDPALMAKAWDQPAMPDAQSTSDSPRIFGQLQNLAVPDNFDDRLPDAEIVAWEGDSPAE